MAGLEDHITFGAAFTSYTMTQSGIMASFSNGDAVSGSILVGADGVKSCVRRQYLPSISVLDVEGRAIYGKSVMTPELLQRFTNEATDCMTLIRDKPTEYPLVLFLEPM